MFDCFRPHEFAESFMEIGYDALYAKGIRGLAFDVDNTLEGYEADIPSAQTADFLKSLVSRGFAVCFVSNNGKERIERFNSGLAFSAIHKSGKPKKSALKRASERMGVPIDQIAMIGDQLFTDVFCGRRSRAYTVLVRPVTGYDPLIVKVKRVPERMLLKLYKRTKLN